MLRFSDYLKAREKAIFPSSLETIGLMGIDLFPPSDYELSRLRDKLAVQTKPDRRPRSRPYWHG